MATAGTAKLLLLIVLELGPISCVNIIRKDKNVIKIEDFGRGRVIYVKYLNKYAHKGRVFTVTNRSLLLSL